MLKHYRFFSMFHGGKYAGKLWKKKSLWILLGVSGISVCLLFLLLFVTMDVVSNIQIKQKRVKEQGALLQSLAFWKNVIQKHPDYRDAYLEVASISYQLGFYTDAKNYTRQSSLIDPNFAKGKEMEKRLSGK